MNIKRITVSALSAVICAAALTPSAVPAFAADASAELQSVNTEYSEPDLLTSSNQNTAINRGDLNKDGLINATDATIVLVEYSAVSTGEQPSFSYELMSAADLNNDGSIDSSDASLILSYYSYISTGGNLRIDDMYPRPASDIITYRTTTANAFVLYSYPTTAIPTTSEVTTTTLPPYEKVTDLKLTRDIMALNVGESGLAAQVTVFPLTATDQRLNWSSSDDNIASIDQEGWVTAYKEGTCTLTVESSDSPEIRGQMTLNVTDPYKVKGIRITRDALDLKVGEGSVASGVSFLPATAKTAETWSSSDPEIAVIDGTGWVKGISPGKCTITVSCSTDPAIKAEIAVTVTADTTVIPATAPPLPTTLTSTATTVTTATPTSTSTTSTVAATTVTTTTEVYLAEIKANKSTMNMKIGGTASVELTLLPANAKDKTVIWESSSPAIASVDNFGMITAKSAGTCVITAYSALNKNVKIQIIVRVKDPNAITVSKIELTRTEMTINIGQCDLSAWVTMLPQNAPDKTEIWESSDVTIATVDGDGWVYGRKAGICIITVSSADNPDVKADVVVTVRNPYAAPQTTAAVSAPAPATVTTARIQQYVEKRDGATYINGILVVNKSYGLPETYAPGMNQTASAAFNDLAAAAAKEGLSIRFSSGYRSYKSQEELYNSYVARDGQTVADTYSARPGHSEHQTGLAIDVNTIDKSFIDTPEAKWLEKHAHEFGFIIRYPKGKENITGYQYEPWHIRFVGAQAAKKIYESGLCLEEYLGIDSFYQ